MKKEAAILIAIMLFVLAACAPSVEKKEPIRIALNQWPGYAHAFIAQEKGFFKEHGVDVELILTNQYGEVEKLFSTGQADAHFEAFADVLLDTSEGIDEKVVYIADFSIDGDVIIAKPGISSLAELKGKRVAVDGINTFSHIFALKALEAAGLSEDDVFFFNIRAQEVLAALDEDRIDAGHVWEPEKSHALAMGYRQIAKAGEYPGIVTDVLAFSGKTIKERPQDVQAVVKALLQARDFIQTNRQEAIAIMAAAENMTVDEMAKGIAAVRQPDLEENRIAMRTVLPANGKMLGDYYLERGMLGGQPEIEELIETKFVDEIR